MIKYLKIKINSKYYFLLLLKNLFWFQNPVKYIGMFQIGIPISEFNLNIYK